MRVLVAMAALVFLAPLAEASCGSEAHHSDRQGDVTLLGVDNEVAASQAHPSIDILETRLAQTGPLLVFSATFAQPPEFGSTSWANRYWLGFHVRPSGDVAYEYMGLRIYATAFYDKGTLVSSNEQGNHGVATLEVTWNESTAVFSFPRRVLEEIYGGAVDVAAPQAQADGRSLSTEFQGFPAGAVFVDYHDVEGMASLVCAAVPEAASTDAAEAPVKESPAPSLGLLLTLALLAALARRQAY
jgi:hypothetical protein